MDLPKEPVIFFKATTALVGPDDPLVIPRGGTKVDWEVELAVVIGARAPATWTKRARSITSPATRCTTTTPSARSSSSAAASGSRARAPTRSRRSARSSPRATRSPIRRRSAMWLTVNGETRQKGTTANMVFGVATLVSYVSQFMTLLPGDVISTGTPAGVGLGMKPEPRLPAARRRRRARHRRPRPLAPGSGRASVTRHVLDGRSRRTIRPSSRPTRITTGASGRKCCAAFAARGIADMEIYLLGRRLVMVAELPDGLDIRARLRDALRLAIREWSNGRR